MKKILVFLIFIFINLIFISDTNIIQASNLEDCFNYYDYAKVRVFLNTKQPEYITGQTVEFVGQIENNNTFPLVNATLYAHLKRVNEDGQSFHNNGHFLIKKMILAENLNFLAGEAKSFSYQLPLENELLTGKYQVNYFIFTPDGFHYSGRPFLEEDVAGYSNFKVDNLNNNNLFYLDINSLKVNNNPQAIKKDPFNIFKTNKLTFSIPVISASNSANLIAKVKLYSFEDTFEELLLETKNITIINNLITTQFDFTQNGAYVVLFEIDKPIPTMAKFRFTVESETLPNNLTLRINDINVSSYPLNNSKAYVCFHSPLGSSNTNKTKLSLQILDENKQLVSEDNLTDVFPPEVLALSLNTNKIQNKNDFYLKAIVEDLDNVQGSYEKIVHFNNDMFDKAISDFSLTVDKKNLVLKAFNVLNQEITNALVNSFLIYQEETNIIFEEKYNIRQLPYFYDLNNLKPGDYQAKAVAGNKTKVFDFSIDNNLVVNLKPNQKTENQNLSYIVAIAALFILFILLIVLTKKEIKKEKKKGK